MATIAQLLEFQTQKEIKVQAEPFFKRADISTGGIFTLYKDSKEIGRATVAFHHRDIVYPISGFVPAKTAVMDSMEIIEEERGKGYGSRFVDEIEKIAKEQGMEMMYLTSVMGESEEFWTKQGYRFSGHKRIWTKNLGKGESMSTIAELLEPTVEMQIPAPFGWPGGKRLLSKRIISLIPPHKTYCEPFCGAASVFWAKEPSEIEVLNDIDPDLMRFYRDIHSIDHCNISQIIKDMDSIRAREGGLNACEFLTDVMCSFGSKRSRGGISRSGKGQSRCLNDAPQFHRYLPQYQERLKSTKLHNEDWEKVVRQYDASDTFFYFDPPYHGYPHHLYLHDSDQLERLAQVLSSIKGKWLLSYDDHEDVKNAFKGFNILPVSNRYTLEKGGNDKLVTELLIANYPIKLEMKQDDNIEGDAWFIELTILLSWR